MSRKPRTTQRKHPRLVALLAVIALLFGAGVVTLGVASPTAAATGGYPNSDMPCSHSPYAATGKCANYDWGPVKDGAQSTTFSSRGYGYRNCTDYVAWKLISLSVAAGDVKGLGNGGQWYDNAPVAKRSLTPKAGDAAVKPSTTANPYGHVAYVESVNDDGTITVSEYNHDAMGNYDTRTGRASTLGFTEFVDFGVSVSSSSTTTYVPPPTNTLNNAVVTMPGRWAAGDSGQDFAYVTKRSDNGFDLAIWKQTATGLVWLGVKWSVNGSTDVQFGNTLFIPADVDGDGLLDLYYATSADWDSPGFSVGYLHNNGNGLDYGGTKWAPTDLKLKDVKFLPGNWVSGSYQSFAYVTHSSDDGFSVATFAANASTGNLTWAGVKWTQPGSSGLHFNDTLFTPADVNGNGLSDLLYTSAPNWSSPGFTMGEMFNDGSNAFMWAGTKWAPTDLKLQDLRLIPGYWSGGNREGFAYVMKRSDGGFNLAVMAFTSSGATSWQGNWWVEPGLPYDKTVFIPADTTGDGYTDLLYATSTSGGFSTAIQYNNTSATSHGFNYGGHQWDQSGLTLDMTTFLPQS